MLSARGAVSQNAVPPRAGHRYGAPMRALILHGPGDLRLEQLPRPEPGAGEIVIAVE